LQKINVCRRAAPYTLGMTSAENTPARREPPQAGSLLPLLGRVLFAMIFIAAAPRHFTKEGIAHAAALGVPLAHLLVPISGALAIAGSLSIAIGFHSRLGAWALILFLVPVTLGMHQFWKIHDPLQRHLQFAMFGKNISMLGAAICFTHNGSGPFSLRG
jgi:putative oxidoreductase